MPWRRSTVFPDRHRTAAATAAVLISLLLQTACGPSGVIDDSIISQCDVYASRAAFAWQNLSTFQFRGNVRLQGTTLVARGPFVLWGDPDGELLRGDFYGPDGKPVVSLRADHEGMTVYFPQDETALYMPGGLQAGSGTLTTLNLIHLIRTGFPVLLEAWQIRDLAGFQDGMIIWQFVSGTADTMSLSMKRNQLFPFLCSWKEGAFSILSSSPDDEYRTWPWKWEVRIGDNDVGIELTEINQIPVPSQGIWNLNVPVPIDTLKELEDWRPADSLAVR